MDRENYEILQVSETATDEEIKEAYERLKKKYNEERWQDGEAGTEAARKLGRVETAYREIMEERAVHDESGLFGEVKTAIRKGDIGKAQSLLDGCDERNAEWHYLQSVVFYKKNWMNESKKQLEIAMKLDPSNERYRTDYEKLKARADYKTQSGAAPASDTSRPVDDDQMGGNACVNLFNTCVCLNCLCNCMYCCR